VDTKRFEFDFDPKFERKLRFLGIRPDKSWVEVGDQLRARFGPWHLETPIANITCATVTGPYVRARAIGPRISLKDRGISYGSNASEGVCILFATPVPGSSTLGLLKHPGLTVTVADTKGLSDLLNELRPRRSEE
jgi:hypothetical protein